MTALTLVHPAGVRAGCRVLGGLVVGLWLTSGTPARTEAQSRSLDAAREAYSDARFADARDEIDRMLEGRRLEWEVVVAGLELRALVSFALEDFDAVDHSLRQLAVLEPHRSLSPETPPTVRTRWEELRGVVASFDARFEVRREGDEVIGVVIANDLEGLARRYRVKLRGGNEHAEADGLRAVLGTPRGGSFELSVAAIGPGGIVLAERRHVAEVTSRELLAVPPIVTESPNRRVRRSLIAVSVVVVVAMAVGVGLSFALRKDDGVVLVGPQP